MNQLTELASNYGDIFCFWFDGACGEGPNGKKQVYDWERYYSVIRNLQPEAVINICGPDVRWCGNEAGHCRKSEWSVVPAELRDAERTSEKSQKSDDGTFSRKFDSQDEDLGSREAIKQAETLVWYPAEVDTSIRTGWFYHEEEDAQVRTAEELFHIYLDAVGANASLLLNIPPDKHGRIAKADCEQLKQLGEMLKNKFAHNIAATAQIEADTVQTDHPVEFLTDGDNGTYWLASEDSASAVITLRFPELKNISAVVLGEYLPLGQHIEQGEILVGKNKIADFTVVGHKRICMFDPVQTKELIIKITSSRTEAALRLLEVYQEA